MKKITAFILLGMAAALSATAHSASLYQETEYQSLTGDRKAYRPGDLLTVLIYENSSASSTANTTAGRDADVGFDIAGIGNGRAGGLRFQNQTDGRGKTVREGRVLAQITVAVQDVLPNGDLTVSGEQLLEVNNERQQIKVAGRVRRQDISVANTVLSTRVADAQISYVGTGDLSDRQRPGWWQRALTWFGL